MNDAVYSRLADTISKHESVILKDWLENQRAEGTLSKAWRLRSSSNPGTF